MDRILKWDEIYELPIGNYITVVEGKKSTLIIAEGLSYFLNENIKIFRLEHNGQTYDVDVFGWNGGGIRLMVKVGDFHLYKEIKSNKIIFTDNTKS
jgi:hypothetical protein